GQGGNSSQAREIGVIEWAAPGALWPFDLRATTTRRRIAASERHAMKPESHHLVEAVVAAFKAGEIVVVTDDDDRENEGDLFIGASTCTPEKMAFIIRHTSGIVCAPLAGEQPQR